MASSLSYLVNNVSEGLHTIKCKFGHYDKKCETCRIRYMQITHTRKECKDFEIKNLGEYHDLYVQSDTLLLADVFEKFRNMCLKMYELDPAKFLWARGLAWEAALKKAKIKLNYLTDIDKLLMVQKGIRGGICHSIHIYANANNEYIKDYDKNKELSYIQYWDVNNLYGLALLQNVAKC